MDKFLSALELLESGEIKPVVDDIKVYEKSFTTYENVKLLMVKDNHDKWLLAVGYGDLFDELVGEQVYEGGKVCPLTHQNRLVLNYYFDYTVPKAFGSEVSTIGLGDRLGLASPGHIETIIGKEIKPILAQQSIRELTLTQRTMSDILDAACFAVFQEGYKGGFGADGDHLKKEEVIKQALSLGMSMLTLDCSDYIQDISEVNSTQLTESFDELTEDVKGYYLNAYENKTFLVNGRSFSIDKEELMEYVYVYGKAIDYMIHVYHSYIDNQEHDIDFEISIDETKTVTSPAEHFFVANELHSNGVIVNSLAPRFCGEFQKGIDYIGNIQQFERELDGHASIADYFGYKLSIHSGSDKFKVFPLVTKYTSGRFHLKTAGTNWLEAIRVISKVNPELYRKMHQFALDNFQEAQRYYHVTPDLQSISALENVNDQELEFYMDDDAARQLFHVTYGLLLTAKDKDDRYIFKNEFFHTLQEHEDLYREELVRHIGNHLESLSL